MSDYPRVEYLIDNCGRQTEAPVTQCPSKLLQIGGRRAIESTHTPTHTQDEISIRCLNHSSVWTSQPESFLCLDTTA
jgi:hypothetical protein